MNYCDSVIGDCRHIPSACDYNARCVPGKPFGKTTWYKCKCNEVSYKFILIDTTLM